MIPSKYKLAPPDDLHPYSESERAKHKIYPDFDPWKHTKEEDEILLNFVSKGYYSTSKVNFESISARSSLQDSLPKLSSTLSEKFSEVVRIREREINTIKGNSKDGMAASKFTDLCGPDFKLPSRLTLTDHRKELWLQELSSPYTPLHKITSFIPHGLKRRQVLEQCYIKQIPLKRAVWLIKCCYSIEWKTGIAKYANSPQEKDKFNAHLLKEWTDNFVHILEKLIFEMTQHYNDSVKLEAWKTEVSYFLKLVGNCYTLELIDKNTFHFWILQFVSKVENFEYLPLPLHILELFWSGICNTNSTKVNESESNPLYMVTKLTDILLNQYYIILHSKSMINDDKYIINDIKKNNSIKESLLASIQKLICILFKQQSLEVFLFPPTSWEKYKPCLIQITSALCRKSDEVAEIKRKLELISYRNETLKYTPPISENKVKDDLILTTFTENSGSITVVELSQVDTGLTGALDDNATDFDWTSYSDQEISTKIQIIQIILWAIHPSRHSHYEAGQLAAKLLLLKINTMDGFPEYEIEDEIWSLVFKLAKLSDKSKALPAVLEALYSLLNTLIVYGLIKVSTYIRKLISSGILYLTESNDKYIHCRLLINLKMSPLMKSQYNMVLKNVMDQDPEYYNNYNFDQIVSIVEDLKVKLPNGDAIEYSNYPMSVKISLGEWYLTYLCNGKLVNETRESLTEKYVLFAHQLNTNHLYFKWIEFIVYHQLIEDIETLEYLMEVLLRYKKLFSQYINDHVLFIKTFIFIIRRILKERDSIAYSLTSFMDFWKFIMKSYSLEIRADTDLRSEMSAVYEEEKAKKEITEGEKDSWMGLYQNIHPDSTSLDQNHTGFSELFLTNLKTFLSSKQDKQAKKKARYNLLLLMQAKNRDYSKFISIYLKRKDFKTSDLVNLLSSKLLTLDQIKNTYGLKYVLELFDIESESNCVFYEYQKRCYIELNYKSVLSDYNVVSHHEMNRFIFKIVNHSTSAKLKETASALLTKNLEANKDKAIQLFYQLVYYQNNLEFLSSEELQEFAVNNSPQKLYSYLDFTNLWLFQSFTKFYINETFQNTNEDKVKVGDVIFSIIETTKYNVLCAKIFEDIRDHRVTDLVIELFEQDFFKKIISGEEFKAEFLQMLIEIINHLSMHKGKTNDRSGEQSHTSYELCVQVMAHFQQLSDSELSAREIELDVFMKIFTVHQNSVFQEILRDTESSSAMIESLFALFERVNFSLRLKLMFYEVLSSLKSYCTYEAGISDEQSRTKLMHKLMCLPPFQVSSFFPEEDDTDCTRDPALSLGLDLGTASANSTSSTTPSEGTHKKRCAIWDKRHHKYTGELHRKPYYCIKNYQDTEDINNCSLNLSLFDARYERNNPR